MAVIYPERGHFTLAKLPY